MKSIVVALVMATVVVAQQQQYTTPVPILKQINKHNEDGSYSYGYEGADGSFKIESKYPNGEVYGKYGYVDDSGKLREIEYGASRRGFEPAGNEINVPPPTLQVNQQAISPLAPNQEDDGQYREDPSVYYKDEKYNNNNNVNYQQPQQSYQRPQSYQQPQQNYQQPQTYQQPQQSYQEPQQSYQPTYQEPTYQPTTRRPLVQHGFLNQQQSRSYQPQQSYNPQPQQNYNYQPQQSYNPQPQPLYSNPAHPNFNPYAGHPASNLDISSGSYSVNYKK